MRTFYTLITLVIFALCLGPQAQGTELYGLGDEPESVTTVEPQPDLFGLEDQGSDQFLGYLFQQQCTDLNGDGICDQTGQPMFRSRILSPRRTFSNNDLFGMNGVVVTRIEPIPEANIFPVRSVVNQWVCPSGRHLHTEWSDGSKTVQDRSVVTSRTWSNVNSWDTGWTPTSSWDMDGEEYTRTRRNAVYSKETGRFHRRNGRAVLFDGQGWWLGKAFGLAPRR